MKKIKKLMSKSLYIELWFSLIFALFVGGLSFILLQQINYYVIDSKWVTDKYIPEKLNSSVTDFQNYVDKNNISSNEPEAIYNWSKKHPLIYFYLKSDGKIIYNYYVDYSDASSTEISEANEELLEEAYYYNPYTYTYTINLSDCTCTMELFENFQYDLFTKIQYFILIFCAILVILIITFLVRKKIHYINEVTYGISILEGGDLSYNIPIKGNDEISNVAQSLNSMRVSLHQQIENEKKALQANNSLVTALSHDLRTPLTTQMGYLEILKEHHYKSDEEMDKYISTALDTCHQIKEMSDRLFEYFLAFNPNPKRSEDTLEQFDGMELFMQLLSELTPPLIEQGFDFKIAEPSETFTIKVNTDDILRIFNNVFTNLDKYADETIPIEIDIKKEEDQVFLSFTNTIRNIPRKNESSKIGLISISSLMKRQGGKSKTKINENQFTLELKFPIY